MLRGLVESGQLAKIGPFAIAAYLVLKASADFQTGATDASSTEVARATGMSERMARTALHRLVDFGLVVSRHSPGRRVNYQIREKVPIRDSEGVERAWAYFDFSSDDYSKLVKEAATAAIALMVGADFHPRDHKTSIVIAVGGNVQINVNLQLNQGEQNDL